MKLCLSPIIKNNKVFTALFLIWVIFQIVWTSLYSYSEWISDWGIYAYNAMECYKHGTMYPDHSFYYSEYIFNPGWINIMILWLHLFGNFDGLNFFLMLLNISNLFLLRAIARAILNRKLFVYTVSYIYMMIPAFSTTAITYFSEIPFITVTLLSMLLILQTSFKSIASAGILLSLSNWIRPLGIVWLISGIVFLTFLNLNRNKTAILQRALLFVFFIFFGCSTIAISTHRNFPDYIFSSSTGGINLIMSANDNATGDYMSSARLEGGLGYIPGVIDRNSARPVKVWFDDESLVWDYGNEHSYSEVNQIYMQRSIKWILSHPLVYICQLPHKIKVLFNGSVDCYGYPLSPRYNAIKTVILLYQKIVCSIVFALALVGCLLPFWKNKKLIYIYITTCLAIAITLVPVVNPRYNFVFLPLIIIIASYSILHIYDSIKNSSVFNRLFCKI